MQTIEPNKQIESLAFELIDEPLFATEELPFAEEAAQVAYNLGSMAMRFARIERVPRYDEYSRENDAEHSFMLGLVATELAATYYSSLDVGLVAQFSTVHDLPELKTGDVATFTLDDAALAAKEYAEKSQLDSLCNELPPYTRHLLMRYETQTEPEARFVRFVDKILPVIVDIIGPGKKVMVEDYDITTPEQLNSNEDRLSSKLLERFPDEELGFIHQVRDILAQTFSSQMLLEMT